MKFLVAIHKDESSIYGVTVPDVPGCFSGGETFDIAVQSAQEAILAHLEMLVELGDPLEVKIAPAEQHMQNADYAGAVWALVDVDLSRVDPRPERVNIK